MTQGNYPGGPSSTPGYGESDQGYGPMAGQSGGGYGAPPGSGAPQGYGTPEGYGAPQAYGAPAGYGAPANDPYSTPTRREDTIGVAGMIISVVGIAGILVSFLVLHWSKGSSNSKFSRIHDVISANSNDPHLTGLAKAYFGWLAWVLLAVVGVVALAANLPIPVSPALRILGLLLGLGGAVVTLFAIKIDTEISLTYEFKHAGVGYWVAIGGFVVLGIGAVIGPRRGRVIT